MELLGTCSLYKLVQRQVSEKSRTKGDSCLISLYSFSDVAFASFESDVMSVRSAQKANLPKQTQVTEHNPPIIEGSAIGSDAAFGRVRVIRDVSEVSTIKPGEILVADMTVSVVN
jgi:hypothetical protein